MNKSSYVPQKLGTDKNYIRTKTPDELGRMPFGKHEFERFENVPVDYLLAHKGDPSISKYPNLVKFIEGLTDE